METSTSLAPLGGIVSMRSGSNATFQPNGASEVDVSITPSERAIAGDYMVTVRASGKDVSEQAQFRVGVQTSTVWGAVGLGVIVAAVLVLGLGIMRYGRR